jgi:hypothetical protein
VSNGFGRAKRAVNLRLSNGSVTMHAESSQKMRLCLTLELDTGLSTGKEFGALALVVTLAFDGLHTGQVC